MNKEYHYYNTMTEQAVISSSIIENENFQLRGVIDKPDSLSVEDAKALALHELPMMIGKKQMMLTSADRETMWRFWNNVQVAKQILTNTASLRVSNAFADLLLANQEEYPEFYGLMTVITFAEFLIGLHEEFTVTGLALESERIRTRHSITLGGV